MEKDKADDVGNANEKKAESIFNIYILIFLKFISKVFRAAVAICILRMYFYIFRK